MDVSAKNDMGHTPLHILAQYGHSNFIENMNVSIISILLLKKKILVEIGADINAVDNELRTPLMNLCSNDDYVDKKTKKQSKTRFHLKFKLSSNFQVGSTLCELSQCKI